MSSVLYRADLPGLECIHRGKVRDVFAVDAHRLLMVASDRLSAFDVVLPDPIPGKGEILCQLSNFWFGFFHDSVRNHLTGDAVGSVLPAGPDAEPYLRRSVVVQRLRALPVEAIVRGYLIGSGWKEYQQQGSVCGIRLPAGLRQGDRLPTPLFTPSTKAALGDHDQNIDFAEVEALIGVDHAAQVREISLDVYTRAAAYAAERGIIIADTKMEFGLDEDNQVVLMDELLTPDSSRFWPAQSYQPGCSPPSFDKQFVRDYLETLSWNKQAPGPALPDEVIAGTVERYRQAWLALTR